MFHDVPIAWKTVPEEITATRFIHVLASHFEEKKMLTLETLSFKEKNTKNKSLSPTETLVPSKLLAGELLPMG